VATKLVAAVYRFMRYTGAVRAARRVSISCKACDAPCPAEFADPLSNARVGAAHQDDLLHPDSGWIDCPTLRQRSRERFVLDPNSRQDDVLESSDLIGTIIESLFAGVFDLDTTVDFSSSRPVMLNAVLVTIRGGWQFGAVCALLLLVLMKPVSVTRLDPELPRRH
jgi:hypothetical protein